MLHFKMNANLIAYLIALLKEIINLFKGTQGGASIICKKKCYLFMTF